MPSSPPPARALLRVRSGAAALQAAARHRAAMALQERVAGEAAADRAARIWGAPGERWFTPDDPIWRVHLDASMFVAGLRALLLQSLHPLAMAGVTEHSGYRSDPWGRLQRTSGFLSTTTFGTVHDAERLIAKVRGIHRRVHGVAGDGRPYRADDPHLLAWVHAAEAESFLRCYQAFGAAPLSPADADTYVAQIGSVSARLGVLDPPSTVRGLQRLLASYEPELQGTTEARDAARFVMLHPPMAAAARPGYALLVAGALATLSADHRALLGIPAPPLADGALHAMGRLGARSIRWMLSDPTVSAARTLREGIS